MCKLNVTKGADLMKCIENHPEDKGIVYSSFTLNTALIHNKLSEIIFSTRLFIHHYSLSSEEKDNNIEKWHNVDNDIMICTSAFGVGIYAPNVKFILHDRSLFTVNN